MKIENLLKIIVVKFVKYKSSDNLAIEMLINNKFPESNKYFNLKSFLLNEKMQG